MAIRTISICTGIGMLDHGVSSTLHLGGAEVVPILYVEREAHACSVLVNQMEAGALAPAPIWSDVRTLCGPKVSELVGRLGVDLLIGGIPCQPHSQAGKRLGDRDPRDLWSPTLEAIEAYRPGVVFIENVSGFASAGKPDQGLGPVVADLEEVGYVPTAGLFTSGEVGASHRRQRTFVLAYDGRHGLQGVWLSQFVDVLGAQWHEFDRCHSDVAHASGDRTGEQSGELRGHESQHGEREADRSDRHHTGGDAVADATHSDRGSGEREEETRTGADGERRGRLTGSGSRLPRYAPGPTDYRAWEVVARVAPDRLPSRSKRETAEREVQRVADGVPPRSLQLRGVGNAVDPMASAAAFISLAVALSELAGGVEA